MSRLTRGTPRMSSSAIDWSDTTQAERWERIIKVENLQADTNLKQAQRKVVVWQVAIGAATAGGAVVGALVALVATLAHWR